MRWYLPVAGVCVLGRLLLAQPTGADPTPVTLNDFKSAAAAVLEETGVPGAGIALVGVNGVEWAGGLGWADRDARVPADRDTTFRAGSISKTFVALALVQLYEDGELDLDAPVRALIPEIALDNPWEAEAPVLVRHILEHTAGFDDMHFNETYVLNGAPDLPLEEVLFRNPASRRVRWQPGTRMSYANPGYAVAGLIVEKVTGQPFEDVIRERIFAPLEMRSSSFSAEPDADPGLAQGYDARVGPPVERRRIYLRPAGALHTSARDLGNFVQMLLGWGERGDGYIVDPEYLSNMEMPRTTAAAAAGVRAGYGLGITSTIDMPYPVLGHNGGIDGFISTYGYSPSRDVGYVVLLNSTHAPEALRRLSSLAIRYLKRDLEPPAKETMVVPPAALAPFEGYYHHASARNQVLQALEYPLGGLDLRRDGDHLVMTPTLGKPRPIVAVNDALFRFENELTASLAFTTAGGKQILAGSSLYAERRARWPFALLRGGLAAALVCVGLAPLGAAAAWGWRRRRGAPAAATRGLGPLWALAAVTLTGVAWAISSAALPDLAEPSLRSWIIFGGSVLYPALAAIIAGLTARAWARGPGWTSGLAALLVMAAHAGLATYVGWWELVGFRSWTF
ncbi:MAG TPA: serine hydrolase domain-containing protein [Vicinamibacterales bacterium]|nr:serine hydrolase domain-containing protein [Vicinamibacterales bacterium]